MTTSLRFLGAAVLTAVLAVLPLRALSPAEATAGRAVVKRHADAIIGVEMVVTIRGTQGDRPLPQREQKREVNGTVIAADGLTVLSLGEIDPRAGVPPQLAQQIRFEEPEFKEVKLRLTDGTEVPARMVLKDEDLDLVFVAPTKASGPHTLPFVNLAEVAQAEVLGNYFEVFRLNKQSQRLPVVRPIQVAGIIEKPRRLFVTLQNAAGCPTFDSAGKVLGISLRQLVGGKTNGFIVLPAEDVAEVAREAAAAAAKDEPVTSAPAAVEPPVTP